MAIFIAIFSIVVFIFVDYLGSEDNTISIYATLSFIIGSFASILSGYFGMKVATMSNYRTTFMATESL